MLIQSLGIVKFDSPSQEDKGGRYETLPLYIGKENGILYNSKKVFRWFLALNIQTSLGILEFSKQLFISSLIGH